MNRWADEAGCIGRGELHLDCGAVINIDVRGSFAQCEAALRECCWKELMPTQAVSLSDLMAAGLAMPSRVDL